MVRGPFGPPMHPLTLYNKGWSSGLRITSNYNNLLWLALVLEGRFCPCRLAWVYVQMFRSSYSKVSQYVSYKRGLNSFSFNSLQTCACETVQMFKGVAMGWSPWLWRGPRFLHFIILVRSCITTDFSAKCSVVNNNINTTRLPPPAVSVYIIICRHIDNSDLAAYWLRYGGRQPCMTGHSSVSFS